MSHLDEWAHLIAKQLKSEAELVSARVKSELYEDIARETFIRVVLDPFLPGSYAVGCGRVIDSSGHSSSPQDIVIYRKDYPQFNMPGSHDVFIYESVLATIQISSKLVRKSFNNALDQCASLGTLKPNVDAATMRAMAAKMNMQLDSQQRYVHSEPLNTNRFGLIGRPQSFIYAFTGYQTSDRQLSENLTKWIDLYHQQHEPLQMKSLPSVIATQGCFAWRNTSPFALKGGVLMGVGIDYAPLRLIILQLMHALNRRLQNTSDGYGIKSTIAPYLAQFEPPAISEMVGTAVNPGNTEPEKRSPEEREGMTREPEEPAATSTVQKPPLNAEAGQVKQATPGMFPRPKIVARRESSTPGTGESAVALDRASKAQKKGFSVTALPDARSTSPGPLKQPADRSTPEPVIKNSELSETSKDDVNENQLSRGEVSASRPDETSEKNQSLTKDAGTISARQIDAAKSGETANKDGHTDKLSSSPPQEIDEDDGFIDTLVETAESLASDTSRPSARKSEYVTESLLQ